MERRPPEEWITIDVPPIISADLFRAAGEQLDRNRQLSRRRATEERYLLQGLTVCAQCGYACYGSTSTSSKRKLSSSYYRCMGRDACRFGGTRVCNVLPVRCDLLEQHVWRSVCQLLKEPQRLQAEWLRRMRPGKTGNATQVEHDEVARLINAQRKTLKRLVDAYEIGAIGLQDLQRRTRTIQARVERAERELRELQKRIDDTMHLRAIVTRLEDFGTSVGTRLDKLSWKERQQIVRMLVAKIEIGNEGATIAYRVAPLNRPPSTPSSGAGPRSKPTEGHGQCPGEHGNHAIEHQLRLSCTPLDPSAG
jgi:site-specific DNA recombinase